MTNADLQPISAVNADQLAVDEGVIRINDDDWLSGAVDPETNEILNLGLFSTTVKQTTRWFPSELHRRYQLDGVEFLVDNADYSGAVLAENGYRFQVISHGDRNSIEHLFWMIER